MKQLILAATALSPLLIGAPFGLSGCGDDIRLNSIPNKLPIAEARVDTGSSLERVGYVINGEAVSLDGTASHDIEDDGWIEDYIWTLVDSPEGSGLDPETFVFPEISDDPATEDVDERARPSFTPDILGTFRIALVVVDNKGGESEESPVFVQSVKPSNLAVELEWETIGADLDLHLIAPDGAYWTDRDAYSWNPNPNWGDLDLALDNPQLDADADGEGAGPFRETINLVEPESGLFRVWVHYYYDHVAALDDVNIAPAANVQVTVRVLGQQVGQSLTIGPNMLEGDVCKVAELSWPDRVLIPLDIVECSDHITEGGVPYND